MNRMGIRCTDLLPYFSHGIGTRHFFLGVTLKTIVSLFSLLFSFLPPPCLSTSIYPLTAALLQSFPLYPTLYQLPMSPPHLNADNVVNRNQEDLALSKALHGYSWDEANHQNSFISKLHKKDKEFQSTVVNNYLENWKEEVPENETEEARAERASSYKAVANSFYDLATDFYEVSCVWFG